MSVGPTGPRTEGSQAEIVQQPVKEREGMLGSRKVKVQKTGLRYLSLGELKKGLQQVRQKLRDRIGHKHEVPAESLRLKVPEYKSVQGATGYFAFSTGAAFRKEQQKTFESEIKAHFGTLAKALVREDTAEATRTLYKIRRAAEGRSAVLQQGGVGIDDMAKVYSQLLEDVKLPPKVMSRLRKKKSYLQQLTHTLPQLVDMSTQNGGTVGDTLSHSAVSCCLSSSMALAALSKKALPDVSFLDQRPRLSAKMLQKSFEALYHCRTSVEEAANQYIKVLGSDRPGNTQEAMAGLLEACRQDVATGGKPTDERVLSRLINAIKYSSIPPEQWVDLQERMLSDKSRLVQSFVSTRGLMAMSPEVSTLELKATCLANDAMVSKFALADDVKGLEERLALTPVAGSVKNNKKHLKSLEYPEHSPEKPVWKGPVQPQENSQSQTETLKASIQSDMNSFKDALINGNVEKALMANYQVQQGIEKLAALGEGDQPNGAIGGDDFYKGAQHAVAKLKLSYSELDQLRSQAAFLATLVKAITELDELQTVDGELLYDVLPGSASRSRLHLPRMIQMLDEQYGLGLEAAGVVPASVYQTCFSTLAQCSTDKERWMQLYQQALMQGDVSEMAECSRGLMNEVSLSSREQTTVVKETMVPEELQRFELQEQLMSMTLKAKDRFQLRSVADVGSGPPLDTMLAMEHLRREMGSDAPSELVMGCKINDAVMNLSGMGGGVRQLMVKDALPVDESVVAAVKQRFFTQETRFIDGDAEE